MVVTVQLEPTARLAPQLCVGAVNAVPVRVTEETVRAAVPVFDRVAVQVLVSPTKADVQLKGLNEA